MLIEEAHVPDAALPLEAFKAHLRMGSGFGTDSLQDEVLVSFLRAAIASIEARTGKALIRREFTLQLTGWKDGQGQPLPIAPLQAVNRLMLVARDGVETEASVESYWLDRDMQRAVLRPVGARLPTVPQAGSVVIAFTGGMAVAWQDVPADLRQAVFLLAAHFYEFRNETRLSEGCMPFGVSSLIERYRTVRMGFGAAR